MEPADIVTLDYELGHRLLGTDIAAQLHKEDFKGVVCVLSEGSSEELESYLKMPGVDMVDGKEVRLNVIAQRLLHKYKEKMTNGTRERSPTPTKDDSAHQDGLKPPISASQHQGQQS